jgi:hypothetical protein
MSELADLLPRHGLTQVHTRPDVLTYRAVTPERKRFAEDMQHVFRTILPFLRQMRVPEDYEEIYQQALIEMQQPDFIGRWNALTVWGQNTSRQKPEGARLD